MAVQQISSGGYSSPVLDATSAAAALGTTQPNAATTGPDAAVTGGQLSITDPIYQLTNYNLNNLPPAAYGNSVVSGSDPFNVLSEGAYNPGGIYNEATSPGYQAYGDAWLNLISTINGLPNTNLSNPNALESLASGSDLYAPQASQIERDINNATGGDPALSGPYGFGSPQIQQEIGSLENTMNPLNLNILGEAGPTGALAGSVAGTANDQGFSAAASQALPEISKAFGLSPNDPNAQTYADAYVTDVLQTASAREQQDAIQSSHQSGSFESILGKIGETGAVALAGGAEGLVGGGISAAAAGGEGAAGTDAAGAGFTAADAAESADIFNLANAGINIGSAIGQNNPIGAITGAVGAAGPAFGLYSGGASGTNASLSNSITSGISNTLGLDPSDVQNTLGIAQGALTVGGAAIPIIQNAVNSPGSLDLAPASQPASTPAASPVSIPLGSGVVGDPLTPEDLGNTSSQSYAPPATNSATLGGGLGSGNQMQSILRSMGEPVA